MSCPTRKRCSDFLGNLKRGAGESWREETPLPNPIRAWRYPPPGCGRLGVGEGGCRARSSYGDEGHVVHRGRGMSWLAGSGRDGKGGWRRSNEVGARGGTWGGPSAPPEKLPWDVEGAGKCGDERREGAERCWRCRAGAGEQGERGHTGWVGCTPAGLGPFHPKIFTGGLGVLGAPPLVPVKRLILAGGAPALCHHQALWDLPWP